MTLLAAAEAVLHVWKEGLFKHGMFDGRNLAFENLEEAIEVARYAEKRARQEWDRKFPPPPPNVNVKLIGVTDRED